MDTTDPYSHQTIEAQSAGQGSKLNISPVQPAQIESHDAHWLRMDPSLARAVLAKTEEELLSSLAALMRNKVEHEQASRKFAQIQIDTEQAKRELEGIKQQIRRAEEEVTTRLNEQSRVNEEIVRVRQELAMLREIENEKAALEETLAPLRSEVDERIMAREALIAETAMLHQHLAQHAADKEQLKAGLTDLHNEIAEIGAKRQGLQQSMAEEQTHVSDLLALKESLEQEVTAAAEKQRALLAEVTALETRLREMIEAEEKAAQARIAEGLPLLFGAESHKIAPGWDPYPLESEFHTDDVLDARKIAELVSLLPGLEGCLIVKNHGAVLASQMPERIHSHLKVPNRNYHLLFDRLKKKVEEYNLRNARLATFDLGEEALTVAQANHAFVLVNHRQAKLRPGMPDKLAAIASEVAKMYP